MSSSVRPWLRVSSCSRRRLLVYCLFAVYPMLDVVWLSFMKWNGLTTTKQFVGFDNYVQVFTQDPVFWRRCATPSCGLSCRSFSRRQWALRWRLR